MCGVLRFKKCRDDSQCAGSMGVVCKHYTVHLLFAALPGSSLLHAAFSSRGEIGAALYHPLPSSMLSPPPLTTSLTPWVSTAFHAPPFRGPAALPLVSWAQIPRSPISAALSAAPAPSARPCSRTSSLSSGGLGLFVLSLFSHPATVAWVTGGEVHSVLQQELS